MGMVGQLSGPGMPYAHQPNSPAERRVGRLLRTLSPAEIPVEEHQHLLYTSDTSDRSL
jgi:hypothetical protein